jgi:hypothetical protein
VPAVAGRFGETFHAWKHGDFSALLWVLLAIGADLSLNFSPSSAAPAVTKSSAKARHSSRAWKVGGDYALHAILHDDTARASDFSHRRCRLWRNGRRAIGLPPLAVGVAFWPVAAVG